MDELGTYAELSSLELNMKTKVLYLAIVLIVIGGLFFVNGCKYEPPTAIEDKGDEGIPAIDFVFTDINPTSSTHNQVISPRNFLNSVTAWYFAGAT
jgi:hypothetical protein